MQPDSASSARATWVDTKTSSGVIRAQIGYRAVSQPKRSVSCAAGTTLVRGLIEVVVGIDQAGQDDMAGEVENLVGVLRKFGTRPDLVDEPVDGVQPTVGISRLSPSIVTSIRAFLTRRVDMGPRLTPRRIQSPAPRAQIQSPGLNPGEVAFVERQDVCQLTPTSAGRRTAGRHLQSSGSPRRRRVGERSRPR